MIQFIRTKGLALLAGIAAMGAVFTSCKDNDDAYDTPSLEITPQLNEDTLQVPAEGSTTTLTLKTNRKWRITSSQPWLDITPSSGDAGSHTITIKVLPNAGTARQTSVALAIGSMPRTLTISQAAADNPVMPGFEGMSLADFLSTYDKGADVVISDDVSFQAVVITHIEQNNTTSKKNITVQAGTSGLNIRLNSDATYAPGALLTFSAKGAKLTRYNGSLQLDYTGLTTGITDTGETRPVEPIVVTLADVYTRKYENVLVAIDGIQFATPGAPLNDRQSGTKYNRVTDTKTAPVAPIAQLSVAISFYAKFKATVASDKSGRIIGILSYSGTGATIHSNLWPRTLEDIQLSTDRLTEPSTPGGEGGDQPGGGGSDNPGGGSGEQPSAPSGHPMITAYLEGSKNNKYLQLYNPTDKEIDLSAYSIKMENFTNSNKAASTPIITEALSGKIPAKGVIVFRHKNAVNPEGLTTIVAHADILNFNGNDNIALYKGDTPIDVIGIWGSAWLSGSAAAAQDVLLRRKATVNAPSTTYKAEEWDSTPAKAGADLEAAKTLGSR